MAFRFWKYFYFVVITLAYKRFGFANSQLFHIMKPNYVSPEQEEQEKKPMEKFSVGQRFKETFLKWCQVTTCAGLIDFSLARSLFFKIFWLVTVIGFLILTIWQSSKVVTDFLYGDAYSATTTVKNGWPVKFPNVTVCNNNRIKNIKDVNLSKESLIYAFTEATSLDYFSNYDPQGTTEILHQYEQAYIDMMNANELKSIGELFHRFGYSCEEMFVRCQWNLVPFNCCDKATEVVNVAGKCWNILYTYGVIETKQSFSGSNNGLKMLINPQLDTYYDEVAINSVLEDGVSIRISYQKEASPIDVRSLAPGTRASIELQATLEQYELSNNPLREKPCVDNGIVKYYDVDYSLNNCFSTCDVEPIFQMVGCVPLGPILQQYKICEPKQVLEYQNVLYNSDVEVYIANLTKCRDKCYPPCEDTWYVKSSFSTRPFLPQKVSSDLLNLTNKMFPSANLTREVLEKLISVNVFFGTLEYTLSVTSERKPIFSFIGDVGGQLSLWIGISVITVIQAIYYCCLCTCCSKQVPTNN